jgi:putative inorganic carbon (HCO3(-)) transporter
VLFFCLILYVSVVYIRPGEIVPAFEAIPFLDIAFGMSALCAMGSLLTSPRKILELPHDWLVLIMLILIPVSNLDWGWMEGAKLGFQEFMPVAFCYFLVRIAVRTPRQLRMLVFLIVTMVLMQAASGIYQHHYGQGLGGITMIEGRIRGSGIFNDPTDLALSMVMIIPFLVSELIEKGVNFGRRLISVAALGPLMLAIFYTNSRGAVLAVATTTMAYSYRKLGKITATILTVVGLVGISAVGPSRASEMSAEEESAQGRIEAWAEGLQMFKAEPLLGVGWSRFTEFHYRVAHNSFVHALAELGFLGAYVFIAIFYWYFRGLSPALQTVRHRPASRPAPRLGGGGISRSARSACSRVRSSCRVNTTWCSTCSRRWERRTRRSSSAPPGTIRLDSRRRSRTSGW